MHILFFTRFMPLLQSNALLINALNNYILPVSIA